MHVTAWHVNYSWHIKPRWTEEEVSPVVEVLRALVDRLEDEHPRLRDEFTGCVPNVVAESRRQFVKIQEQIDEFLHGSPHAVVGASSDRSKYGNKVLRAYQQRSLPVFPVNPHAEKVEGVPAYADLASLPEAVHGISVITPPKVTELIVEQAGELGIKNVWMQPGSESEAALSRADELGMNVIAGGPCALVVLGFREY